MPAIRLGLRTFVAALVLNCWAGAAVAQNWQEDDRRIALVIGVAAYENAQPLVNTVNDSREISNALRRLRFEVFEVTNPTISDLKTAQDEFVSALAGADVAVLYYAGHSVQVSGANYLIPVDARLESISALDIETFAVAPLINRMDRLAKVKVVILDACRDNPFVGDLQDAMESDGRSRGLVLAGLASVDSSSLHIPPDRLDAYGTIVAYAAAPGAVAADGSARHSPYTAALLAALETPGLEVASLFRQVAASVIEDTAGRQKPEYLVKLSNEFYFLRPEPSECDLLAVAEYNQVGIPGVQVDAIDYQLAIPVCEEAVRRDPDNPRLIHNLGRAYDAASDFHGAVAHYRTAAGLGFVPAVNNLGVMYINGQGVSQDFERGVDLLQQAYERGNQYARIALQTTDYSVIFRSSEFIHVQEALSATGDYAGKLTGAYDATTRRALESYQQRNGLSRRGLTLETLDALELLRVIPHYTLQ